MRDQQRLRVYRADEATRAWVRKQGRLQTFSTLEEVETYVRTVVTWATGAEEALRWQVRRNISVRSRRRLSGARAIFHSWMPHSASIELGGKEGDPSTYNAVLVLHEVAHCFAPQGEHHGPLFASIFLRLVQQFIGSGAAAHLMSAYQEKGVAYRPTSGRRKRAPLTEEQKAVLRERLKKARAARAAKRAEG